MGTVRTAGIGLVLAFAGTMTLGAQAALATVPLPAAPAPGSLTSAGAGTTAQTVTLPVEADDQVSLVGADGTPTSILSVDNVGSYQLTGAQLTFRPALGYVGMHGVLFRETDAYEQTGDATYTAQVTLPAPPVAAALTSTGVGTAAQAVTVDVPGQGSAVLLDPTGQATTSIVIAAGTFTIDPTGGAVTFAPAFGFAGQASVGYQVSDAYQQSASATYTATVAAPTAPVALPTTSRAAADVQQSGRVAVPAGATLSLLDAAGRPQTHVYLPGQGNYALDPATDTIVFTPGQGFYGVGSLMFELTDGYGQVARNTYTPVVLRPRVIAAAIVPKRPLRQHVVLVPPLELVKPAQPTSAPAVVHVQVADQHRQATPAPVRPRPVHLVRHVAKSAIATAAPAPVASGAPVAATVVQQLAAGPVIASPVSTITRSKGKMAGLCLIVVNVFVGVTALVLNRRRQNG